MWAEFEHRRNTNHFDGLYRDVTPPSPHIICDSAVYLGRAAGSGPSTTPFVQVTTWQPHSQQQTHTTEIDDPHQVRKQLAQLQQLAGELPSLEATLSNTQHLHTPRVRMAFENVRASINAVCISELV